MVELANIRNPARKRCVIEGVTMAKKIAYVVNQPGFFVSHRLMLGRRAQAAGYEIVVISPDGPGVDAIRAEGFAWRRFPLDLGGLNPFRELGTILALYRVLR